MNGVKTVLSATLGHFTCCMYHLKIPSDIFYLLLTHLILHHLNLNVKVILQRLDSLVELATFI